MPSARLVWIIWANPLGPMLHCSKICQVRRGSWTFGKQLGWNEIRCLEYTVGFLFISKHGQGWSGHSPSHIAREDQPFWRLQTGLSQAGGGFLGFSRQHLQAEMSWVKAELSSPSGPGDSWLRCPLKGWVRQCVGGLNRALSSLRSSPPGASPGAAHRHRLTPADAQLALPPASGSHPASPRRLPTARPPAARSRGPAPHPPHLRRRRHHPTQRQRSPPQWRGGRWAPGWPCHPWPRQQGRGEEE